MAVAPNRVPEDHPFFAPTFLGRAFESDPRPGPIPTSRENSFLSGMSALRSIELAEKPLDVERPGYHRELAFFRVGPRFAGTVPGELDAVLVRVAEVEGLGDAVIGGAVYGVLRVEEVFERLRQLPALGVEDGEVKKTRGFPGGGRDGASGPGVEADVVVVTAG